MLVLGRAGEYTGFYFVLHRRGTLGSKICIHRKFCFSFFVFFCLFLGKNHGHGLVNKSSKDRNSKHSKQCINLDESFTTEHRPGVSDTSVKIGRPSIVLETRLSITTLGKRILTLGIPQDRLPPTYLPFHPFLPNGALHSASDALPFTGGTIDLRIVGYPTSTSYF
jgi:hypothetical protein